VGRPVWQPGLRHVIAAGADRSPRRAMTIDPVIAPRAERRRFR
jgi:hypothetical protein